ncbi:MAG TPA: thiamine pyrophosphate-dependent enzyme, partial [Longimicrobiales bacterium]|nr:thiamine pyrophosphate-dependent enzyme [Longimicrobiales bacterium]
MAAETTGTEERTGTGEGTGSEEGTESRDIAPLTAEDLLRFYRIMVTSRRTDDREISMKRQNRIFFQISSAGHEAVGVGVAAHTDPAKDWYFLYYRDRAFALSVGQTPLDHLLQAVAAADDPASGGRQMPSHFTDARRHIASSSSPTGTQFLQAVGAAEAGHRAALAESLRDELSSFAEDEIVVCCTGEGATSEGEFWEALNTACNLKLPVLFVIEDNGYAISVPVEVQTAGGSVSKLVAGFPNLLTRECDGTDVVDVYRTALELALHCRHREGPALLHAHCIRPYSHSMSDDERMYRPEAEREAQEARDPLRRTRQLILDLGAATGEELGALEEAAKGEVSDAADAAMGRPQPEPATATRWLYSEEVDPTGPDFATEPDYGEDEKLYTVVDLLNMCLADEMERDERIVVFGQDVADASREEVLEEVKGKGGVFKVTHGLQGRFGSNRVYNSPLAEANIIGRAVGMAVRGMRPVVEIQFLDYIWPGMQQLRNELATMRYRSAGSFQAPVVIRVTYGGYLKGGAIYHSQTGETLFTHTPGLRVVLPSNAEDANGLLRTAIRCDDPVMFLEHKHLYRQVHNKGRYPGREFMIPFGKARIAREGRDMTIVTCG